MTGNANEEAEQYGKIIDKINKVADNFPTTSADIMDALKKVSSAFNLAGADIDETIATIVAAEKASQRGGKVIGTALSNIIQQIKAEKKLDLAEELGLNFFKDAKKTEFKPIMEIFQEMSDRMDSLKKQGKESSVEMQQLLELFTVFRRNIGASLLGEMAGGEDSTYMKVYKTSLDSVGYSIQENAKYMATAKAAQEQFNTSVLQLKTEVWDSGVEDVYKSMLIFGKQLVNNIGELIKQFGGLPVIVGTATLAFSLLSKQMKVVSYDSKTGMVNLSGFAKELTNIVKKLILSITAMPKTIKNTMDATTMSFTGLTNNLTTYGVSLDTVNLKTLTLKATTVALNLATTAAATAGVMLLTSVIQALINKEAEAIQMQEDSIQSTKKQITERENEITSLESLIKEYDELAVKTERTPEETIKLQEIQTQIKNILGEQADTIDLINGKYDTQRQKIKELSLEKRKELLDDKEKLMIQKQNEKVKVDLPSFVQSQLQNKNYEKTLMEYGGTGLYEGSLKKTLDNASLEEALELFTKWEKSLRYIYQESDELGNTYNWVNKTLSKLKDTTQEADAATEDYYQTLAETVYKDVLDKYSKDLSSIQTQFGNIDITRKGITWDADNIKKYKGQLQELGIELDNLEGSYSNVLGASKAFSTGMGNVEIAYSPMLQTDKGLVPLYQDEVDDYIQEVVNQAQEAVRKGEYTNLNEAILGIDAKGIDDFVDTQGNKIKGLIADVGDSAIQTGEQMHKNWEQLFEGAERGVDSGKDFAILLQNISKIDFENLKALGINTKNIDLNKLKNNLFELAKQAYPEFEKGTETLNNSLKTTGKSIEDLSKKIEKLQSKYNILTTAQKELSDSGEITISTFKNLMDNDLLRYLDVVNGKVVVNTGSINDLAEQTKILAIESLQAAASEDIHKLALGEVDSMSDTAKSAINNLKTGIKDMGTEAKTQASAVLELASATAQLIAAQKEKAEENGVEDFEAKANAIANTYKNLAGKIGSIKLSFASSSTGGKTGKTGKTSTKDTKKEKEEEKKKKDYEKRLEYFTNTIDRMESKEEEWVKKQKELGQLSNSDMVYVTKRRIKEYEKYLDKIKKADWMNKKDRKKLQDEYNKKLKEAQLDYFDYLKGKLEDETKAIEKSRDERIKALEEETKNRKKLIEDEADARIAALKKVSDSRDRDREKEDYEKQRKETLDEIAYWQQRTGREAVENLAKAKEKLKELDDDWAEKVEDWNTDDLIKSIEEQRDAQIKALEAESEKRKENIENETQAQINAIQATYDAKVKAFSESDEIIFENSKIASKNLYDTYKKNFVDPLKEDLKYINKKKIDYTVKKGDTLESIAKEIKKTTGEKVSTIIKRIKNANSSLKNTKDTAKLKKGTKIKIPMYHKGGIFEGTEEGLAMLKKGEWVLRPEWSNSLNRMMKYFDNITQGKATTSPISNGNSIEVNRKFSKHTSKCKKSK